MKLLGSQRSRRRCPLIAIGVNREISASSPEYGTYTSGSPLFCNYKDRLTREVYRNIDEICTDLCFVNDIILIEERC